ncbi:hypothetical protein DYD21_10080 [Rhodohalobacter sp. SW132]|uniref:hypothetical protein n=1 Tax=Rhodohalobacter sp. SW132 TaxID=2293433 RepID=UPI000E23832E|nr:hypothetical protein [Rhodohalobacter sp. SW132]REL33744.1 hypothetical protein DYD21_10080 [Rhodohalobacter sp. SW132]
MKSIKKRIQQLENADGFKNDAERREHIRYARLIDDCIKPEQIKSEQDYINLLKDFFKPIPA